eukprot:CAMPEP_0202456966 /NCGR_PEP_ID=MMETSP1360-20130828/14103_1 /ASSEMBLY_ACC=CAM_ASM_000848 /TAXON_ID=515479 /ORGANISM="Licmophora paradoxa, Strain CCMP2313" /LENGTH=153 /DNA_ID=CAMNT_0049076929 /DNA_START=15 /DNA_END=476 /DNA_ORIENTATION=+
MKLIALLVLPAVAAFSVAPVSTRTTSSALSATLNRRDAVAALVAAGTMGIQQTASAFSQQLDDYAVEPSQQANDGKIDLNGAFVGDYMQFPGMFPHAAGKIASNGPYAKVGDIYKIDGISDHDKKMFKQYQKNFTVRPPGRMFKERINARVST